MKFYEQKFKGVWLIETEPVVDHRGIFYRHFCQKEFEKAGLRTQIVQTNISENPKKLTLRGFHYQVKPFEEEKIFRVAYTFEQNTDHHQKKPKL